MGVVCILTCDDHVVPSTWVSCECEYIIAGGGCLSLDAHSSSLGAPGSHGSDSFLHPQCCCVSGPDVLAGSGRPGLSMVVPREVVCLPPFSAHCDLVGHASCSPPALCVLSLLSGRVLIPATPGPRTQFPALPMAAFSLSVDSQLKCHLLRGGLPCSSYAKQPPFHFLS